MNANRFFIFAVIFSCAVICTEARGDTVSEFHGATVENVDGVRVVRLHGAPYEIGLQHGTLLKNEINTLLKYFFEDKGGMFGISITDLEKGTAILKEFIPAEYLEEIRGIAEGSGVPLDRALAVNVFLDVVSAGWVGVAPGCSNFAVLADPASGRALVHGRNLDWSSDSTLTAANTVFFITPEKGVPFVSLSWPGMAGTLTGMNAKQISMGEMTSVHNDASLHGVPIMIQLRMLLQYSGNLDQAYDVLADNPRTTGYNVLVTDGKANDGFVVEMNAKSIYRAGPKNEALMHTNHYTHKKLYGEQLKLFYIYDEGTKSDSFYRYKRLETLLGQRAAGMNAATAMEMLGDKFDPVANKISGSLDNTVCKSNTLQSAVMLPQSGEIHVALKSLPAPDGGYVRLTLPLEIIDD